MADEFTKAALYGIKTFNKKVKEKIGIEKLIGLLNENTNGRFKTEQDLRLCIEMRGYCRDFIKWLVESDKIDLKKLYKKEIESGWSFEGPKTDSECLLIEFANQCNTEIALMLLSISEKPIEFLISILK